MAKLSMINRNVRKQKEASKARVNRNQMREMIKDPKLDYEEKSILVEKLNKKPRNESPIRVRSRCRSCGRSRAIYRKFGLCRLCLRKTAMHGDVPGLVKASW